MAKKKKVEEELLGLPKYEFRYTVSLQDIKDKNLFKDVLEDDTLSEIRKKCKELVAKHKRSVIIFDNNSQSLIEQIDYND